MKLEFILLQSPQEIENIILSNIAENINIVFSKSLTSLQKSIPNILYKAIISEPEYQSLISGKLLYEFGIPDASKKVNNIINIWTNNFFIETIPVSIQGSRITGGFRINMIKDNYDDVLSSESAYVIDEAKALKLPWLEWLLLNGGKIIIRNYEVQVGASPYSRTGLAIMKPSKKNWRVPSEFAGTKDNNWITRALNKLDESIPNIIQKEIEKNL
jgi:hypothetical protein